MAEENRYAPHYHFAPTKGWINDPNGLVYFDGRWHLFYQYYEPASVPGMQWGHAVSSDLLHFEHLEPALQPDALGQIWSGSAVVDQHDTSGLFGGRPGLVCLFTYWDQSDFRQCQGLAYSADGIVFHKWRDNPVIPQLRHLPGHPDDKDFRDPKVFWHESTGRWVMVVAGGKLRFFSSENLLDWRFESCDSTIDTECPDLFELPIEAENGASSWVLSLGGRAYMLGEFDGSRFTPTTGPISMSGGPDFYASQSFSNEPAGRRIILSWLFDWSYGCKLEPSSIRNVFPTGGQAGGCLTVPYELSLARTGVGPRLRMRPAREVDSLRTNGAASGALRLNAGERRELPGDVRIGEVSFVIRECPSGRVGLRLKAPGGSYSLGYDRSRQSLFVDRRESGLGFVENYLRDYEASPLAHPLPMRLRILLDRSSVELFAEDGASHMSAFVLPDPSCSSLEIYADSESLLEDLFVSRLEL